MTASAPEFRTLNLSVMDGVATVTLLHPPINLFDAIMIEDLEAVAGFLESDASIKVMVLQSADPDFFSAHADVAVYCENGKRLAGSPVPRPLEPTRAQRLLERFRRMPKATIAKVEGRLRGGGSCLVLAMDMCFAALDKATFGHPEIALGLLPAIGGSQRLPQRSGRARALEIILGGDTISAELAERYGYINRALPADELGPFVAKLAARIASYSATAIALAKRAVDAAEVLPINEGLIEEAHCFDQASASPEAQRRMSRYLENGQSREFELKMAGFVGVLAGRNTPTG
jgi:enoyl-CoA hydratase/carnithine racemase